MRPTDAGSSPKIHKVHQSHMRQSLNRVAMTYTFVVAGAGPAGLAAVGTILEYLHPYEKVLWVDPSFEGGSIGKDWREVPSNTRATFFRQYAEALGPFRNVIAKSKQPNAFTIIKTLDESKECSLSYAADLCVMLSEGLSHSSSVDIKRGKITAADWDNMSARWKVYTSNDLENGGSHQYWGRGLVLCTGSHPSTLPAPVYNLAMTKLPLETALTPSNLVTMLPKDAIVAVVGGSHSAILVLLNLFNLASTTHPHLQVRWFRRKSLKYAEYKNGWILHDNTGLKGCAASFARNYLEDDAIYASEATKYISTFDCYGDVASEEQLYAKHLPGCTHIISAIGFTRNAVPTLTRGGDPIETFSLIYNNVTGYFSTLKGGTVPALFGAGIAFPELVTDCLGNKELNVGMWKFMKFLKRAIPEWLKNIT
ncbi:hypothetical protein UCRPC4_g04893 [Phaeomoniella chlamydospora]|uniref:FAD/NAD(P)-binding domain-containing protein n=1 Tax=Phaeomoniella chlamydospora TaxID=158046 RepID=A0A0G2E6A0_PHACM|nr:hypothetical protein UCRPC4_g04893 [Phaeomoniella chlamydospora]